MPLLLPLSLALACSGPPATVTPAPAPVEASAPAGREVGVDALANALDADAVPVLVDVRTPAEYASGHVTTALNIPLADLGTRVAELAPYKNGPVYLICQSGGRSGRAMEQLLEAGFLDPINVLGGTGGWIAAGKPVE